MIKTSTVIITFNEEKNLPRCIGSVTSFSDEIIVVDSGSTDKTIAIAKSFGAKVYKREFDSFDKQKNFACGKAHGKWIFSLDADEEVTKELSEQIPQAVESDEYDGYLIPRKNIILKAEIRHTRWSPDKHVWLFKKGVGKWTPGVHSEVEVKGRVGQLTGAKMHYQYETVSEFLAMVNRYTESESIEKVERGEKYSVLRQFWDPFLSFTRRFMYKRGFSDGWRGFVLSYIMAIYRFAVWVKVWEKND